MNRNHLGVAVLLAIAALALTACGGDRGATSATSLSVLPGGS